MRNGTAVRDGVCCCNKGKGRNQHFVAGLYTNDAQCYMERCCAIDYSNSMTRSGDFSKLPLKPIDVTAHRGNPTAVQTVFDVSPFIAGKFGLMKRYRAIRLTADRIEQAKQLFGGRHQSLAYSDSDVIATNFVASEI